MRTVMREAVGYAAASVPALFVDVGLLYVFTHFGGWDYRIAAAVSFFAGATVAYALSVRYVWSAHRLRSRQVEFAAFVLIGIAGWGVNLLVLLIVHGRLGLDLMLAKGCAIGGTFVTNFALRRQLLFRLGPVTA